MNLYANLAFYKRLAGISFDDVADDSLFLELLEGASRRIDRETGRHFYAIERKEKQWRVPVTGYALHTDDLVSVASITIDDVTLAAADYELLPLNDSPKTRVRKLNSKFTYRELVKVTAKWGYAEETEDSGTTLNGALNTTATSVVLNDASKVEIGQTLRVDSEQLYVSAISTATLTVTRGVNDSTAATHSNSAAVSIYRYPRPIEEAVARQAYRLHRGRDAAWSGDGAVGGDQQMQLGKGDMHWEIARALRPFKRIQGSF